MFAAVSRVRRGDFHKIQGYQRPEVLSHIDEIRRYLESDNPMLPNSLVIAFDRRVQFIPSRNGNSPAGFARHGTLVIPADSQSLESDKPGWVVDGQQRVAAIRDASVDHFPVFVTAFIADGVEEQRAQFILVNATKPLPKGLVYELLPGARGRLPSVLGRRQFPAKLMERLNYDADSPMMGMIQTTTNGSGIIKDNSVLKMLENSLGNGALYCYRDAATGAVDEDAMLTVLKEYWAGVSSVFVEAWNLPPRRSRLMHGAGIVSMGLLMDAIHHRLSGKRQLSSGEFATDLEPLKKVCRWTAGAWEFAPGMTRNWNDIQNTPKDIQLLSDYLLSQYKRHVARRRLPSSSGRP